MVGLERSLSGALLSNSALGLEEKTLEGGYAFCHLAGL